MIYPVYDLLVKSTIMDEKTGARSERLLRRGIMKAGVVFQPRSRGARWPVRGAGRALSGWIRLAAAGLMLATNPLSAHAQTAQAQTDEQRSAAKISGGDPTLAPFRATVKAVGAELGLPVADPQPALDTLGAAAFIDAVHPTEAGHRALAEEIVDVIVREGLLKKRR